MEVQEEVLFENLRIQNNLISKDYEINPQAIYKGAYGQVRKVVSKFHGKERVMKIINKYQIEEEQQERIMRNVGNIQNYQLQMEQGMLKVYEFYQDEKSYFMIQQECLGPGLIDQILDDPKLDYNEYFVSTLIQSLLKTFKFGHENDIVHGNIKLGSFYWSNQDKIDRILQVVDFGLSMSIHNKNYENDFKPTEMPYFIAPEILDNQIYDSKCDMWSIGVLTYILLSGLLPFDNGDEVTIYEEIEAGIVDFSAHMWKDISKEGHDFLKGLLKSDPENRLSAEQALQHDWFKVAEKNDQNNKNNSNILKNSLRNLKGTVGKIEMNTNIQNYFLMEEAIRTDLLSLMGFFKQKDAQKTKEITRDDCIECIMASYNQVISEEFIDEFKKIHTENVKINYEQWCTQYFIDQKKQLANRMNEQIQDLKKTLLKQSINDGFIFFFMNEIKRIVGSEVYLNIKVKLAQFQTNEMAVPFAKYEQIIKDFVEKDSKKDNISQFYDQVTQTQLFENAECNCYCNIF